MAETNRTLGFLRRNSRIGVSNIKAQAHKSLVRSILEYSRTVRILQKRDTNRLVAVQRRAARFALNRHQRTASVKPMLQEFDRPSLEHLRSRARVGMLYKSDSRGLAAVRCTLLRQQPLKSPAYPHLNFREDTPPCRPSPQLILPHDGEGTPWNALAPETVTATSLDAFVSRVSKLQ